MNKNYSEEYARQLLHICCGYDLSYLRRCDKPDLQDCENSYGIEVVNDTYPDEEERDIFIRQVESGRAKLTSESIKRYKKFGASIETDTEGKILSASLGPNRSNSPNRLIQTVKAKMEKIGGGEYKEFRKYAIFVFVHTTFVEKAYSSYVTEIINEVAELGVGNRVYKLYLDQHYTLCVCDLIDRSFIHIPIDKEKRLLIEKAVIAEMNSMITGGDN